MTKAFIKPIETPQSKLQIKASPGFNKAVEELKFHQRLLRNPDELQKLISSSKNRVRNLNRQRISALRKTLNSSNAKKDNSFEVNDVYRFEDVSYEQQSLSLMQDRQKRASSFYEGMTRMGICFW